MKMICTIFFVFAAVIIQAFAQSPSVVWWQKGSQVQTGGVEYSPDGTFLYGNYYDPELNSGKFQVAVWDTKMNVLKNSFAVQSLLDLMEVSDSYLLQSGGIGATIEIYNIKTGEYLRTDTAKRANPYSRVWAISFLPGGSEYAVYSSSNDFLEIIDAATGKSLRQISFHTNKVLNVSFSYGGNYAAATFADSTISAFSVSTGTLLRSLKLPVKAEGIDISDDGKKITTGQMGYTAPKPVKVYDLESGSITGSWHSKYPGTNFPRFSPDGKVLVWATSSGSDCRKAYINDTSFTDLPGSFKIGSMKFSPSSMELSSFSNNASLQIWNMDHNEKKYVIPFSKGTGHLGGANGVVFSKNEPEVLTVGGEGAIRVWNTNSGNLVRKVDAHLGTATAIAISRSGDKFVTGSGRYDNSTKLWNSEMQSFDRTIGQVKDYVMQIQYSPDDLRVGAIAYSGGAYVWDLASGSYQRFDTTRTWLRAMAFSPDNVWLAIGGRDRKVTLYKNNSGHYDFVREFFADNHTTETNAGVTAITFSPDNRYIFTSTGEFSVRAWEIESGTQYRSVSLPKNESRGLIYKMHSVKNGEILITAGADNYIRFIDIQKGEIFLKIDDIYNLHSSNPNKPAITDIALSPDLKFLAATVDDGDVVLFDISKITTSVADDENMASNQIDISPNPATTSVRFSFPEEIINEITIFDRIGNSIDFKNMVTLQENSAILKTDGLASGLYFVKCVTSKGTFYKQFIISK